MENAPDRIHEGDRGAQALDGTFEKLYGRAPDGTFRGLIPDSNLDQVVYYHDETGKPHWHFISYGFSQLGGQPQDEAAPSDEESGSGYEVTFRIPRTDEATAPQWVDRAYNDFANYSFENQIAFRPYDYVDYDFDTGKEHGYAGFMFVQDSRLKEIETPNGTVAFLQVVPVSAEQLNTLKVAEPDTQAYTAAAKRIIEELKSTETDLLIANFS
ncbi:MAG: branched-chain alpha-keto acid dehydrogenase subunit [Parcubacteria group bacterium]|nr:branched-chain alpha-keto acid dehydrogenase subunit [Parcubacteria group bacterium]